MVRLMKGITQKLVVTDREDRNWAPYDGVFKIQRRGNKTGWSARVSRKFKKRFSRKKKKKVRAQVSSLYQTHDSLIISSHFRQFLDCFDRQNFYRLSFLLLFILFGKLVQNVRLRWLRVKGKHAGNHVLNFSVIFCVPTFAGYQSA